MHRIEQRQQKPLVQEVPKPDQLERSQSRKLIEEVKPASMSKTQSIKAEYSLVKTKEGTEMFIARISVPAADPDDLKISVIAGNSLTLSDSKGNQLVGATLPRAVEPQGTKVIFNSSNKIMTVLLPVAQNAAWCLILVYRPKQ